MRWAFLALVLVGCARTRPPADPLAAGPPPPRADALEPTRGAGGPAGDWEDWHALGEQRGRFEVYVPAPGDAPYGVAVLLPADDETPKAPTRIRALRDLADERGLILVAMDTPGPVTSGCWWSPHKQLRADYVVDLLQTEIFARYDVDPGRVHLAGKSGGAFFAAGVPFYRALPFRGGVVGVCGGDVPREESDVDWCAIDDTLDDPVFAAPAEREAAVGRDWRLFLAHTARDPWVANNDDAAALWTRLGAPVRHEVVGPGGHCRLDDVGWLVAGLTWVDAP